MRWNIIIHIKNTPKQSGGKIPVFKILIGVFILIIINQIVYTLWFANSNDEEAISEQKPYDKERAVTSVISSDNAMYIDWYRKHREEFVVAFNALVDEGANLEELPPNSSTELYNKFLGRVGDLAEEALNKRDVPDHETLQNTHSYYTQAIMEFIRASDIAKFALASGYSTKAEQLELSKHLESGRSYLESADEEIYNFE